MRRCNHFRWPEHIGQYYHRRANHVHQAVSWLAPLISHRCMNPRVVPMPTRKSYTCESYYLVLAFSNSVSTMDSQPGPLNRPLKYAT
jgi:hypothetical protein